MEAPSRAAPAAAVIAFEPAEAPAVRTGEFEVAGRRVAVRALPYGGRAGHPTFGFDPVERVIFRRRADAAIGAGPADPRAWEAALSRLPAGPVLVGPSEPAGEPVWGAFAAACEGARLAGRPVYLLDPPGALPSEPGPDVVALVTWSPAEPAPGERIRQLVRSALAAGYVFPLLPGWTSDRAAVLALVGEAREAGASFIAPVLPDRGGASRRTILEARAETAPSEAERIFGRVHHGDWEVELTQAFSWAVDAASQANIPAIPPRPRGRGEPAANAAAAARLEELAVAHSASADEHRAAMVRAAVRWIDGSGRDLAAVAREGNFGRVFPFGSELAREAERALLDA